MCTSLHFYFTLCSSLFLNYGFATVISILILLFAKFATICSSAFISLTPHLPNTKSPLFPSPTCLLRLQILTFELLPSSLIVTIPLTLSSFQFKVKIKITNSIIFYVTPLSSIQAIPTTTLRHAGQCFFSHTCMWLRLFKACALSVEVLQPSSLRLT